MIFVIVRMCDDDLNFFAENINRIATGEKGKWWADFNDRIKNIAIVKSSINATAITAAAAAAQRKAIVI